MARVKKEKCLTCHHPLEEHTSEICLHWNWDIGALCKCKDGSDGVPLNKKYGNERVLEVVMTGKSFIVFTGIDGSYWRWMPKQKQLFPFKV